MLKPTGLILGGIGLLCVVGLGWWFQHRGPATAFRDHQHIHLQLGSRQLLVEVVNTPESTTQGLSGRSSIGSDGMLFVFPKAQMLQFWMKEMKFGLDFIWLNNWTVVDLTQHVPPPSPEEAQNESLLTIYSPKQPADMVIEVNDGDVSRWGVQVGDTLKVVP